MLASHGQLPPTEPMPLSPPRHALRPTCLPMGSGLVTVVLKKPSHSSRP